MRFYAAELVLAIECIHKKGIVHRDIKVRVWFCVPVCCVLLVFFMLRLSRWTVH